MQEFSSISVSTYEPDSLVGQLNEHAAAGWDVVAIVPTGSTVTAYLSRAAAGGDAHSTPASDAAPAAEPAASEPAATPEPAPEPTPEPATPRPAETATAEVTGDAVLPTSASTPATTTDPTPAVTQSPAAEPAAQPAQTTGGAPAGWYADPSSRFELRYWDGTTWTEHVSRGGQQYTDPPVA